MIIAYGLLVPCLIFSVWIFFKTSPTSKRFWHVRAYNFATLLVALLVSANHARRLYTDMAGGPDSAWWPVLSSLAFLVITTCALLVSGLIRNFIVFRDPNKR